jgi:cholestenol Delta-isomerase
MAHTFSPTHPYYPLGLLIPDYQENALPVPVLLAALGGMLSVVLLFGSTIASRTNPRLTSSDLAVICWFVLCKLPSLFYPPPRVRGQGLYQPRCS